MSDLNPTQRQEALDTIDDAMRVLGGMGRQGLNVRLQRLRKALSNPTSSVSTEGVADGLSEAWTAAEAALPEGWEFVEVVVRNGSRTFARARLASVLDEHGLLGGNEQSVWSDSPTAALQALTARLTAINPDSPVEPDRG